MGRALPALSDIDPRGLIEDAYCIEGIGEPECRSIFLDWAIGVPPDRDAAQMAALLLAHYGETHPDHPMSRVLREGQGPAAAPGRRGGRRGRAG